MIDDKIGIIGKTQGVKESNNPKPKNVARIRTKFSLFKLEAIESTSFIASVWFSFLVIKFSIFSSIIRRCFSLIGA
jgi:hypothetical protein